MPTTAFFLSFLICGLYDPIPQCIYLEALVAPFPTFEECADEGIRRVRADKQQRLNGYRCEERPLER